MMHGMEHHPHLKVDEHAAHVVAAQAVVQQQQQHPHAPPHPHHLAHAHAGAPPPPTHHLEHQHLPPAPEPDLTQGMTYATQQHEPEPDNGKAAAAFLEKLYDILEDPSYEQYISWCQGGTSILIKQVDEFSSVVLPKFFKHSNFQSFVRQLNMYSFSKTKHDPNWREFRQPHFIKGKRHLLKQIKRKSSDTNALAKQTRSKLEDMLTDVDKLKGEVANAKSRLGLVEAHLWMTTDKCNLIQNENQSLWKILCDSAPQVKQIRDSAAEAAGAPTDEQGQLSAASAAAYAARFQQIHNALRSLPTTQLPVNLQDHSTMGAVNSMPQAAPPAHAPPPVSTPMHMIHQTQHQQHPPPPMAPPPQAAPPPAQQPQPQEPQQQPDQQHAQEHLTPHPQHMPPAPVAPAVEQMPPQHQPPQEAPGLGPVEEHHLAEEEKRKREGDVVHQHVNVDMGQLRREADEPPLKRTKPDGDAIEAPVNP